MKLISETRALEKLARIRNDFASRVRNDHEHRAKSCAVCETPGACCMDEHFVNVRISRLEAVAIRAEIRTFSRDRQAELEARIAIAADKFRLREDPDATYACPLFQKGTGCAVHSTAKPLPCIAHACYENEKDLPPDELLAEQEGLIDTLNRRTYGNANCLKPLPLAIVSLTVDRVK